VPKTNGGNRLHAGAASRSISRHKERFFTSLQNRDPEVKKEDDRGLELILPGKGKPCGAGGEGPAGLLREHPGKEEEKLGVVTINLRGREGKHYTRLTATTPQAKTNSLFATVVQYCHRETNSYNSNRTKGKKKLLRFVVQREGGFRSKTGKLPASNSKIKTTFLCHNQRSSVTIAQDSLRGKERGVFIYLVVYESSQRRGKESGRTPTSRVETRKNRSPSSASAVVASCKKERRVGLSHREGLEGP